MKKNDFYKDTAVVFQRYTYTPEFEKIANIPNSGEVLEALGTLMKRVKYPAWIINPNNFSDDELMELNEIGIDYEIDFEYDERFKIVSEVELKDLKTIKSIVKFII